MNLLLGLEKMVRNVLFPLLIGSSSLAGFVEQMCSFLGRWW